MHSPLSLTALLLLLQAGLRAVAGVPYLVGWGGVSAPVVAHPIAVAGGDGYTLALGTNGSPVLATDGPAMPDVSPPADLNDAISIAAGDNVAVALRAAGSVRSWGRIGQPPADLTNAVAIAAGWEFCAALKSDGTVRCWGTVSEPPGLSNIVSIAAGGSRHVAALRSDGTVVCWGGNSPEVTNVPPDLSNVIAVSAGVEFTVALRANGTVVAWGSNPFGATNVPPDLTGVVAISAENASHVLALKADGTVVAWGRNSAGQCNVPSGLKDVIAIAAGSRHSTVIVRSDPTPLPLLVSPSWNNGRFRLQFPAQSRRVYQIEAAEGLGAANWTPLGLAAGNGGIQSVLDSETTASSLSRFYRVRRW